MKVYSLDQFTKMNILGYEIRKKTEQRGVTIGPSTPVGLPYSTLNGSLSAETSMKLSAVYRCVDVLGSDIATMPWDIMVYKNSTEWIRDDFHFSYAMLNEQPNPSCSAFTFKKTLISRMLLNGNGYARIYRDDAGNPVKLQLLTGDVVMYIRDDMSVYYSYKDPYTLKDIVVSGDDMIHIPNFTYDGLLGISTLTHAANITGLATSADGQAKGFFASGANLSGIISVPGKIDPDKAKALKTSWGEAFALSSTTGTAGGVAVMEGGAEFKPVSVNPKDAQMLETRAFNVIDLCRFFGVHPSKAFDTSTSTYGANVESYQLGYITDTITPLAKKIDNEVNRKLYRPSQRIRTKAILRVSELLSNDYESKANYYTQMFQVGAYSPNEIRKELNKPLIPDGDKSYVQVNLAEVGTKPEPIQNKNTNVVSDGKGN